MSFAEVRLELGIDYGTVGGFRFNTSVLMDGSGGEQRNANWAQPLGRWQIGDRKLTQSELDYFLDFHAARKGAAEGFRFRDWADYQAEGQPIGIGNGGETQFQLIKTYTIGVYTAIRPILKPVGGTVNIYSGGIQQAGGWTVDLTTGIITFANPPASGVAIAADFEFDVPVRFEQDNIEFRFEAYEVSAYPSVIFFLQSLTVVEIRLTPDTPIPFSPIPQAIAQTLNLGYDYGTVGGPAYNTTIATTGGGHERRTSNWSAPRGRWQVGDRTLKREELDYLIAFHRLTRGAAASFLYKDWQQNRNVPVRFEEDSLSVRFDAYDPELGEVIFYLAGLQLMELIPLIPAAPAIPQGGGGSTVGGGSGSGRGSGGGTGGGNSGGGGSSGGGGGSTGGGSSGGGRTPPFSGGQCVGVRYRVEWEVTYTSLSAHPPGTVSHHSAEVWGPVAGLTTEAQGSCPPGYGTYTAYYLKAKDEQGSDLLVYYQSTCSAEISTKQITSIIPLDGAVDNCGDPPTI